MRQSQLRHSRTNGLSKRQAAILSRPGGNECEFFSAVTSDKIAGSVGRSLQDGQRASGIRPRLGDRSDRCIV